MTAPAERVVRLLAWKPDDPPSPGLVDDLEGELLDEVLSAVDEDTMDQIIQATLAELTQMGLVEADVGGGYWLTAAGEAALGQPPQDDGLGGPLWTVTLYRPGRDLPWGVDEIAEVTEAELAGVPAGVDRSI